MHPNQAVQLTPLARYVGWAQFTRQSAPAYWHPRNAQPSDAAGVPAFHALQGSAARTWPGSCLLPWSSTLHTPASGAADARRSAGDSLQARSMVVKIMLSYYGSKPEGDYYDNLRDFS